MTAELSATRGAPRSNVERMARAGGVSLAGAGVAAVAGVALMALITNNFDKATAGRIVTSTSLFLIATAVVQLGTDIGLVRWIPTLLVRGHGHQVRPVVRIALIPVIGASVLVALLGFSFSSELAGIIDHTSDGGQLADQIKVLALFLPVASVYNTVLAGTRGFPYAGSHCRHRVARPRALTTGLGRRCPRARPRRSRGRDGVVAALYRRTCRSHPVVSRTVATAGSTRRRQRRSDGRRVGASLLAGPLRRRRESNTTRRPSPSSSSPARSCPARPGRVGEAALEEASGKKCGVDFGMCYSPEFIALGSVVRDFLNPDFILIGESDTKSGELLSGDLPERLRQHSRRRPHGFGQRRDHQNRASTRTSPPRSPTPTCSPKCATELDGGDVDAVASALGQDTSHRAEVPQGLDRLRRPVLPARQRGALTPCAAHGRRDADAEATTWSTTSRSPRFKAIVEPTCLPPAGRHPRPVVQALHQRRREVAGPRIGPGTSHRRASPSPSATRPRWTPRRRCCRGR